jgi:hypothetical protein
VKYTTGYDLAKSDDGEVYLVPTDDEIEFEPKKLKCELHNLFNGNKVLGKLRTCTTRNVMATDRRN